jgi:predicted glycosyltransferase
VRRNLVLAAAVVEADPDAAVLVATSADEVGEMTLPPAVDVVKLPGLRKLANGRYTSRRLGVDPGQVRALRAALLTAAVESFRPSVLVADKHPFGIGGELRGALRALHSAGGRAALGLRDILDDGSRVREEWARHDLPAQIAELYDRVLVYGDREIFDVAQEYGMCDTALDKLRYCGYLCTPRTSRYARRIRQELLDGAAPGTRLVVAMAGGGADAFPVMLTLLHAAQGIVDERPCRFVLIAGPFMPRDERRRLQDGAAASGLWVRVREKVSDTLSYIDAADALVTMAGYNTTVEVLRAGRRMVMVPRSGPSAEQRLRAELFSARGWVDAVPPEQLGPEVLAASVLRALERSAEAANGDGPVGGPALDGVRVAVDALLEKRTTTVLGLEGLADRLEPEPADDALAV